MTSELKCPVCNHKLYQTASEPATYCCLYKDCQSDFKFAGSKELWQALIQAKQDLVIATKALEEISFHYQDELDKPTAPAKWFAVATKMCDYTDEALEQIEHKE